MTKIIVNFVAVLVSLTTGTVALFAEEPIPQTEFVFNLYREVVKSQPDENTMISPYSVQLMLDLLRTGAAGKTRTEIEQVLGHSEPINWKTPVDKTLAVANSLWTQQGFALRQEFLQTVNENFDAALEQVDFVNNPDAAVKRINAWCSDNTNKKIPEVVTKDHITKYTRLILANAIYFAAKWEMPFNEENTHDGTFTLQNGEKVKTKLMSQYTETMYCEDADTIGVILPYKPHYDDEEGDTETNTEGNKEGETGTDPANEDNTADNNQYAMLLLLPKNSAGRLLRPGYPVDFAKWESEMTVEKLDGLLESMYEAEVDLMMPRFKVESPTIPIKKILSLLGMPTAFDENTADFSEINSNPKEPLFVSEILHKTFINVDETGTEAAAVTMAVGEMCSGGPPVQLPKKRFYANRPFLYCIVKIDGYEDGTILFLGRFVKPNAEK